MKKHFILYVACFFSVINAQDKIDSIKIYDCANNLAYSLVYHWEKNNTAACSLYDRTGYFLCAITQDSLGRLDFKDDNGDLFFYSGLRREGKQRFFDIYDHFNKPAEKLVFQGFFSREDSDVVRFSDISSQHLLTLRYLYAAGRIERINVLDAAGALSHHVEVFYNDGGAVSGMRCLLKAFSKPAVGSSADVDPRLLFDLLYVYQEIPGLTQPPYFSPAALALSPDGKRLYVAGATARRVTEVDISAGFGTQGRTLLLPKEPTGLAVSSDGRSIYVTCASDLRPDGEIFMVDAADFTLKRSFGVGHSARSPVISPDGNRLYICNRFKNIISIYNTLTGGLIDTILVVREPFAAALTPDGKRLVVTNFLPYVRTRFEDSVACGIVSIINTDTRRIESNVALTNGAQSLAGICVSTDGKYAYVSHLLSNFNLTPLKHTNRTWINMNVISVVDIANDSNVDVVPLDRKNSGAADPWGIACDSSRLYVVSSGSQMLHVMKLDSLHQALERLATPRNLSTNLNFAQRFTQRVYLKVKGAQSVGISEGRVFIGGYFSDSVEAVAFSSGRWRIVGGFPLVPSRPWDEVRSGAFYFSDATKMGREQWQSCASCHAFGRMDALKWDLANDGNGNFKNARSLLYAHITPPVMWTGVRDSAELAVRAGVGNILMSNQVLLKDECLAIDAYLKSMRHVPSPFLDKGRLSAAAKRGKTVFSKMQCGVCHLPESYYTDMRPYPGLKSSNDFGRLDGNWDTPALIEAWRTAPYLHDGRCLDMEELFSGEDRHELSRPLTPQELADLIVFVKSL